MYEWFFGYSVEPAYALVLIKGKERKGELDTMNPILQVRHTVWLCFKNRKRKPLFFCSWESNAQKMDYTFKTLRAGPIRTKNSRAAL
jgi:hypothetical protein